MKFSWRKNSNTTTAPADNELQATVTENNIDAAYEYKVYSSSETGPTRTSNEDFVCSSYPDGSYQCIFAMVADGMGGHNAGEVASEMSCTIMKDWVQRQYAAAKPAKMLADGILEAHRQIKQAAAEQESRKGMGTTSTALFIRNGLAYFAHVGDSRLYHASGTTWRQCSTDHTLVNQLVMSGELPAEAAAAHPMKNYITQAVGYTDAIVPEAPEAGIAVKGGDRFLLISDGVYDVLSGDELGALIMIPKPELLLECIRTLCTVRKSSDNFSVLLVTVSDGPAPVPFITKEQNALL